MARAQFSKDNQKQKAHSVFTRIAMKNYKFWFKTLNRIITTKKKFNQLILLIKITRIQILRILITKINSKKKKWSKDVQNVGRKSTWKIIHVQWIKIDDN